ncbi:MAG: hypothetical protein AAB378_01430 [Patescibacteria group bacterium]
MNFIFRHLPYAITILLAVVLGTHGWSVYNAGYFMIWWLDIVLHFLGGLTVGLFFFWFFYKSGYVGAPQWPWYVVLVMTSGFVLFVGIQWEFFEFLFDTFVAQRMSMLPAQLGIRDTMGDLFMDWMGALFAGLMFFCSLWKKEKL